MNYKNLIGVEDINFATGGTGDVETFDRRTSTGALLNMEKFDATHLQFRNIAASVESAATNAEIADNFTTIAESVSYIGSEKKILKFMPGYWNITADLTIPENILVLPEPGAIFKISNGVKLTIENLFYYITKLFEDENTDLDGVIIESTLLGYIIPELWGAVKDGVTNSQDACQATINCAINSTDMKVVHFNPGSYLVDALTASNTAITIKGENRYRTKLIPSGNGYALTVSGPAVNVKDLGFYRSSRAAVGRGLRIYNASVVSKWVNLDTLYFENLKGSAIKIDGVNSYEFTMRDIVAAVCGDNTINGGSNDEAVIDVLGGTTNDQNNITVESCNLNAFHGPALRVYNANTSQGGWFPGFRMLRVINNMMHGGTSYADLTTQPVNNLDIQGVSDGLIAGNNFALTDDEYYAIKIDKASASAYLSRRIRIENNRLNGAISLSSATDITIGPNDFVFAGNGTGTFSHHIVVNTTCGYVKIDKQKVGYGDGELYVNDRGVDNIISNSNDLSTKYWYQAQDGLYFLQAAGYGTGINGCKNVGGNVEFENPATTAAITFDTDEDDINYNVILSPNFDTYAWVSDRAVGGFTINIKTTPASTGYVFWYIYR